jgi:hypothetical protein
MDASIFTHASAGIYSEGGETNAQSLLSVEGIS